MKYTSAEANKLLKQLNDEIQTLLSREAIGKEFLAAVGEDIDSVRPDYSFLGTQRNLSELEEEVRIVKHAINIFNTTTVVGEFNMTVDQMLVYIPQMYNRKLQLEDMVRKLPKVREQGARTGNIIDYRYINYSLTEVEKELENLTALLNRAQNALDTVNGSLALELEI